MTHYGDQKTKKYSGGGGGDSYNWDAHYRSQSQRQYEKVKASADPAAFLMGLSNTELMALRSKTRRISRYGDYDWNRIVALLDSGELTVLKERLAEAEAENSEQVKQQQAKHKREWEERQRQAREAKERLVDEARLTAGHLHSELAAALAWKERYDQHYGEWLDDPVAALTGQGGFGEEVRYSTGIKLEVNIALDCSNSMYYNGLHSVAVNTMRTLYMALELVSKQLPPGSLTLNAWCWALSSDGKYVRHLNVKRNFWSDEVLGQVEMDDENPLGAMEQLPSEDYKSGWTGEDTWIYPLLEAIDKWEQQSGDPGAYRLDIILSDGVLEHPTDVRKGDEVQFRRNGNLQSVILNFLPMESWGDYNVPNRCVQYEATVENIGSLMRSVLGDWVVGCV